MIQRRLALAAVLLALAVSPAGADWDITVGSGTKIKANVCETSKQCPVATPVHTDGTTLTGPAGTPTTNAITVQGSPSGAAVPISGSVSVTGTVTVGTHAVTQSGTWNITNISGTVSLPTGAATAAGLTTINSTLGSPFQAGGSIGNTTFAATQATASNLNATVVGTGTFATQAAQSGTWNITNVSGTVSLPTGAATSAAQTTGNSSLSSIDTKTPSLGQALAAASLPVVMTAAQITTLTPLTSVTVTQGTGSNLHVVCDSGCSGSGGTSSNFVATFPSAGTAVGMSQGGNMVAMTGTSGNLNVQCANCSGSGASGTDEGAFTAGSSVFAPGGGFFQTTATSNALTNGQWGAWQLTAQRAGFVNVRNASGAELGVAAAPFQVSLANTGSNATAVLVTGTGGTFPVSQATAANLNATVVGTGTFAVQAAQSGTWNVTNISGTVSLPTGASTAANQTSVIGTKAAGTAATNSMLGGLVYNATPLILADTNQASLQGDANGYLNVNVKVATGLGIGSTTSGQTGSLVMGATTTGAPTYTTAQTNPISLTTAGDLRMVFSNTSIAATQSGTWSVRTQDGSGNAINSTSNALNVNCANCSGSGVSQTDEGTFTAGTSLFASGGGFFQTTATSNALTNGQFGTFQVTANRALFSNLRNAAGTEVGTSGAPLRIDPTGSTTQPVSGTVTANAGSGNFTVVNGGTFAVQAAATLAAETTKVIGTVRTLGNAGAIFDFAGQNASSPANAILYGCQFQTTPTTITPGNASPCQLDNAGNTLVNIKAATSLTVTATNLSTNVAQINGVTPLMGNGASGTGVLRVAVVNDNSPVAGFAVGATGSAPPANAHYMGANGSGATGGLLAGLIECDSFAPFANLATATTAEIVPLTASRTIYICGWHVLASGTTSVTLKYGTGTNCGTGTTPLTDTYDLTAQVGLVDRGAFAQGLKAASANALCVTNSAAQKITGGVYYAKL